MADIVLYTDGGARGNPGPAALGVYIETLDKRYGEYIGRATNNEAEYQAIVFALKKVRQLVGKTKSKNTTLELRSDSELIVKQLNGLYKLKEARFYEFFIEIWNRKQDFSDVQFVHVKRSKNVVADAALNEALDRQKRPEQLL